MPLQTTVKIFIFLFLWGIVIIDNSCASSVDVFKSKITLHEKEATFSHIIEVIEDLTDIKITVRGVEPNELRDVWINDRAFDKAIPQILHLFGVQDHSAIYYTKPQHRIELLIVGPDDIEPGRSDKTEFNRLKSGPTEEFKTLTKEDFSLLPSELADGFRELSSVEFTKLTSEPADGFKELSSVGFSGLPSESAEPFKTIRSEEFSRLPQGEMKKLLP